MHYNCTILQISQANYIEKYSALHIKNIFFVWFAPKLKKFVYNIFNTKIYISKFYISNVYSSKVYSSKLLTNFSLRKIKNQSNIYQSVSNQSNTYQSNIDQSDIYQSATGTSSFYRSSYA